MITALCIAAAVSAALAIAAEWRGPRRRIPGDLLFYCLQVFLDQYRRCQHRPIDRSQIHAIAR